MGERAPESAYAGRTLAVLMSGLALAAGVSKRAEAHPANTAGVADCLAYVDLTIHRNHEYEACTAYIANSAEIALQAFYKYGNNRIGFLADTFRHHFETRYWASPRKVIENEVDGWPKTSSITGNDVQENIKIVSVSSSLSADRGLVQTLESWNVTDSTGHVLHNEPNHVRNVTLCRGKLAGHLLHEWMVVQYARNPQFNCISFDKSHNITP